MATKRIVKYCVTCQLKVKNLNNHRILKKVKKEQIDIKKILSILVVEGQLYQNYINEKTLYTPIKRLKMVRLAAHPPIPKKTKTQNSWDRNRVDGIGKGEGHLSSFPLLYTSDFWNC